MKSLIILGRQPALGLAELESLYGSDLIEVVSSKAALLDIEAENIAFARLGGSVKLAKLLTILDTTNWRDIEKYLSIMIPEHLQYVPEGKFKLGLSLYDMAMRVQEINATALRLKKIIKNQGRSVRIIPNKYPELNSAQVLHNQLTSPTGWELVLVRDGARTLVGLTFAEQDIDAYAKRDQNRPMRDAKVGMLPPKLAQIIINLAAGQTVTSDQKIESNPVLLDPFCGTGVLLQESIIIGYAAYGSDLEPRMIEYSDKNLTWLFGPSERKLEVADATTHTWKQPIDLVACETFLGKPLTSIAPPHVMDQIIKECDDIHERFLRNIGPQIKTGTRLCLAVPAWKTKNTYLHLKTLDLLDKLGYTRKSFVHASNLDLVYRRPDQVVARELVILIKK